MARHLSLDIGSDRIAVLTLNHADLSANVLTSDFIGELEQTFGRLKAMKEVRGLLVRSGKPKMFIAGANIEEIEAITDSKQACEKSSYGQAVFALLGSLPYPSVAAIDGPCLGGGLELALACTYRVAGDGTHVRIALPEVKLGIIPGFGGTQRMPKVVGFLNGIDMIVTGKTLDGIRALKMGLVDDVTASEILENVAKEWLKTEKRLKRPTRRSPFKRLLINLPPIRKLVLNRVRAKIISETKGQYPAPLAAVEVIEKTFGLADLSGYDVEARKCADMIVSDTSKALIHVFHASEEIRKEKYADLPKPIGKVGLVGAGVMGGGLAHLVALKGRPVRVRDISFDALSKGMQTVFDLNLEALRRRRLDRREFNARNGLVSATTDWTGFHRADFVIEAVVEKMSIKQHVFKELSEKTRPDTILATNTSALSITEIAKAATNPERVIGLHFFNPVGRMPLVEVIRGEQTSPATVSTTVAFALSLGKTPIVCTDRPGFLVNRILGIYLTEAVRAAEEGIPIQEIEEGMTWFGMPMGPFELMDEVGLDIAEEVGRYLKSQFPYFPEPAKLLTAIRSDGRLGKKSGKGFYVHEGKKRRLDVSHISKVIGSATRLKDPASIATPFTALSDRFVLLMVNEAARCLEEGVVRSARDVDIGMVFGTGFAPFRGGLAYYANHRGIPAIVSELEKLASRYGEHFRPTARLREFGGHTTDSEFKDRSF